MVESASALFRSLRLLPFLGAVVFLAGCNGEPNLCATREGWVNVSNVSGRAVQLSYTNTAGVVAVAADLPAADSLQHLRLAQGTYQVQTATAGVALSAMAIEVTCTMAATLLVTRTEDLTRFVWGRDGLDFPVTPVSGVNAWGRDQLVNAAGSLRNSIPGLEPESLPVCIREQSDLDLTSHLVPRREFLPSPLVERLKVQNKEKVETFLAEHFPEIYYGPAAGQAVELVFLQQDQVGAPGNPLVESFEFRVKPAFMFLNNGQSQGGAVQRLLYEATAETPLIDRVSIRSSFGRGSSLRVDSQQLAGATTREESEFDYMVWRVDPSPSEAWELGFTRRDPCFPEDFFVSFRLGIAVDPHGGPRFGEWTATDLFAARCVQGRQRMAVHTRNDFIRRMLMDVTGVDQMVWEEPGDGSFIITYTGSYDCPREYILPRR